MIRWLIPTGASRDLSTNLSLILQQSALTMHILGCIVLALALRWPWQSSLVICMMASG
jgi:hypothetical protein